MPAIETLTILIDLRPSDPDLYAKRAKLHKSRHDSALVYQDLLQIRKIQSDHPDIPLLYQYVRECIVAYENRASEFELRKDLPSAITVLSSALSLDPEDWMMLLKRGILYARIGREELAMSDINQYLADPARDVSRDIEGKRELAKICISRAQKFQE